MHEQMRQRRRASAGVEHLCWSDNGGNFSRGDSDHALDESLAALKAGGNVAAAFFTSLGKAIGESSTALVQSIKKVASQPALAGPCGQEGSVNSLGTAADGVLSSLRQVKQEWMSRRLAAMGGQSAPPLAPRNKQGAKVD